MGRPFDPRALAAGPGLAGALRLAADPFQVQVVRALRAHRFAAVAEPEGVPGVTAAVAYAVLQQARRDRARSVLFVASARVCDVVGDIFEDFGGDVVVEPMGTTDAVRDLAAVSRHDHVVLDTRWSWRERPDALADLARFMQEATSATYVVTDHRPQGLDVFHRLTWATGGSVAPLRRVWARTA